uniref:Uncharacterized protein n=1 Tax=Arion vulgaris TaxID=1028688 RepID=A0A0B6ZFD3_9EUPU
MKADKLYFYGKVLHQDGNRLTQIESGTILASRVRHKKFSRSQIKVWKVTFKNECTCSNENMT